MHIFHFLEKCLGIVSPPHFAYYFYRKMLHMLYLLTDQVSLPLLLKILVNLCIASVCESGCDVITFEINLIFLIKPFFYMKKKSRQKFKYLENKKSF